LIVPKPSRTKKPSNLTHSSMKKCDSGMVETVTVV